MIEDTQPWRSGRQRAAFSDSSARQYLREACSAALLLVRLRPRCLRKTNEIDQLGSYASKGVKLRIRSELQHARKSIAGPFLKNKW